MIPRPLTQANFQSIAHVASNIGGGLRSVFNSIRQAVCGLFRGSAAQARPSAAGLGDKAASVAAAQEQPSTGPQRRGSVEAESFGRPGAGGSPESKADDPVALHTHSRSDTKHSAGVLAQPTPSADGERRDSLGAAQFARADGLPEPPPPESMSSSAAQPPVAMHLRPKSPLPESDPDSARVSPAELTPSAPTSKPEKLLGMNTASPVTSAKAARLLGIRSLATLAEDYAQGFAKDKGFGYKNKGSFMRDNLPAGRAFKEELADKVPQSFSDGLLTGGLAAIGAVPNKKTDMAAYAPALKSLATFLDGVDVAGSGIDRSAVRAVKQLAKSVAATMDKLRNDPDVPLGIKSEFPADPFKAAAQDLLILRTLGPRAGNDKEKQDVWRLISLAFTGTMPLNSLGKEDYADGQLTAAGKEKMAPVDKALATAHKAAMGLLDRILALDAAPGETKRSESKSLE